MDKEKETEAKSKVDLKVDLLEEKIDRLTNKVEKLIENTEDLKPVGNAIISRHSAASALPGKKKRPIGKKE